MPRSLSFELFWSGRLPREVSGPSIRAVLAGLGLAALAGCGRTPPATTPTVASCVPSATEVSRVVQHAPGYGVETFDSAWTIIARSHWDTTFNGVNWTRVRDTLRPKAAAAANDAELRAVLESMVGTLGQSHFSILAGERSADVSAERQSDKSGTIGATIRDVNGRVVVLSVRPAGPAARAGLVAGTVIESVDGCGVAARAAAAGDKRRAMLAHWSSVSAMLRGPVGDSVRLGVRDSQNRQRVIMVVRDVEPGRVTKIGNLPPIAARLETEKRTVGNRTVGIIRFNSWMAVLAQDLRDAVDSLRDADGIVVDVRGNLGGMAMMATGAAGHFVDSTHTLGTMIQRGGAQRFIINPQRVNGANQRVTPFAGPLAIVVDELSISTTEIFAAGLQSLGRARIFGAQSAGQALPSVAERLPNGDVLYHAIANFLSPTGRPVEGDGVIPDVAVPLTREALLKGWDPALDAAVDWAAKGRAVR
ncbi:MAG: S41 family peptidase [Gemmatimonas sp.]